MIQLLTSSLKSSLKGSISVNCRSLGKPPTLWCDLIVWLCFWSLPGGGHDSMTSGYLQRVTSNLTWRS